MNGIVTKSTGSWYDAKIVSLSPESEPMGIKIGTVIKCRLKGIFRLDEDKEKDSNPVAVGDRVVLAKGDADDAWVIEQIQNRENYMVRSSPKHRGARQVIAANMDQALLIVTMASPRTSTGFIDRFLTTAEAYHIPAKLIFNKQDLLNEKLKKKQEQVLNIYQKIGYETLLTSALANEGTEELKRWLKGKISLIAGHSGVGKSTLLNMVQPNLQLRSSAVSKITGKGMHTTTFAEMYPFDFGGQVIDTPGIREFGILDFRPEEISHYFVEFRAWLTQCKFNNCLHQHEPGCGVKQAYAAGEISEERYKNYLNIMLDYKAGYKHWE